MLGADPDDLCLVVHYEPTLGSPGQIDDRIALGPRGEMAAVNGIGRLLRILRAGRIQPPRDPYALASSPEEAAALINRCRGARVRLKVARRLDRVLTVWTEAGVDRIREVVDFGEDRQIPRPAGAAGRLRARGARSGPARAALGRRSVVNVTAKC